MAIRTVSLRIEAYERLRSARRYPGEWFSQVVLRAHWPEQAITGAELLARMRSHGPFLTEEWHYAQAYRYLRANGLLIGANDLWIAAAGIAYRMPVLTRNTSEFRRVPGSDVLTHG